MDHVYNVLYDLLVIQDVAYKCFINNKIKIMSEVKIICPHCGFVNIFDCPKTASLPGNKCLKCDNLLNVTIFNEIKDSILPAPERLRK